MSTVKGRPASRTNACREASCGNGDGDYRNNKVTRMTKPRAFPSKLAYPPPTRMYTDQLHASPSLGHPLHPNTHTLGPANCSRKNDWLGQEPSGTFRRKAFRLSSVSFTSPSQDDTAASLPYSRAICDDMLKWRFGECASQSRHASVCERRTPTRPPKLQFRHDYLVHRFTCGLGSQMKGEGLELASRWSTRCGRRRRGPGEGGGGRLSLQALPYLDQRTRNRL